MNSLEEAKQSVIEDFSMYDEWLDKYEYLIDLGKNLEAYPESEKTEDKLIKGCQSRVWLDWRLEDGKLWFKADSDAIITSRYDTAERFLNEVNSAAVYVNASTRFTDGEEFGFGAEIGISTQKLHARGPMGLSALTTVKYVVRGSGQIR